MSDDASLRLQAPAVPKPRSFSPTERNGDLCALDEASRVLGLHPRTLERQVIKPGSVIPKPFKVGGKRMWRRQDLEAFLAASALLARARGRDHG